tara:strand:+ start:21269 stop:21496 length:228 start_codon:yes stop_codon:yes gene_type:complete
MREQVIEILKSHFGDKPIEDNTHLMDDLGGDEFDIVDVILQVEEKLNITIPEEETFEVMTVSQLLEVVGNNVQPD